MGFIKVLLVKHQLSGQRTVFLLLPPQPLHNDLGFNLLPNSVLVAVGGYSNVFEQVTSTFELLSQ